MEIAIVENEHCQTGTLSKRQAIESVNSWNRRVIRNMLPLTVVCSFWTIRCFRNVGDIMNVFGTGVFKKISKSFSKILSWCLSNGLNHMPKNIVRVLLMIKLGGPVVLGIAFWLAGWDQRFRKRLESIMGDVFDTFRITEPTLIRVFPKNWKSDKYLQQRFKNWYFQPCALRLCHFNAQCSKPL